MNTIYEDADLKTKLAEAIAAQDKAKAKVVDVAAAVDAEPKQVM